MYFCKNNLVHLLPRLVVMVATTKFYEGKESNLIYFFFFMLFILFLRNVAPDGSKLSVLLTFPYVIEKCAIFPA